MAVASPKLLVETPYGQNAATSANPDKDDIHKMGVILLELLTGRQITSESLVHEVKQELERSLAESASGIQHSIDLSMRGTYAYQSIKTAVELTLKCLSNDPSRRPPMEDRAIFQFQASFLSPLKWL